MFNKKIKKAADALLTAGVAVWIFAMFFGCDATTGDDITNKYTINKTIVDGRLSTKTLYDVACSDARLPADDDARKDLLTISAGDRGSYWNEDKSALLMCIFHNDDTTYTDKSGEEIAISGIEWAVSAREFKKWRKNNSDVTLDAKRVKQLLGQPEDSDAQYIATVWVKPADIRRAAYQPDITKQLRSGDWNTGDEDCPLKAETKKITIDSEELSFYDWFNRYIMECYFGESTSDGKGAGNRPWTRMGYTYDWANNGVVYGLSEFIIIGGSDVKVTGNWNGSVKDFDTWLSEQAN